MNIILFGPPGAGKGTQAQKIVNKFNLYQASSGDLLRNEIKNKSDVGKKIEQIISQGDFVADDIVNVYVILCDLAIVLCLVCDRDLDPCSLCHYITSSVSYNNSITLCRYCQLSLGGLRKRCHGPCGPFSTPLVSFRPELRCPDWRPKG